MKKLNSIIAILVMALVMLPAISEAKPKQHLPFAPKGKYGKFRTRQCKPVKQKEYWWHRQWGRN